MSSRYQESLSSDIIFVRHRSFDSTTHFRLHENLTLAPLIQTEPIGTYPQVFVLGFLRRLKLDRSSPNFFSQSSPTTFPVNFSTFQFTFFLFLKWFWTDSLATWHFNFCISNQQKKATTSLTFCQQKNQLFASQPVTILFNFLDVTHSELKSVAWH